MKSKFIITTLALALLASTAPSQAQDAPAPPSISVLTAQKKAIAEDLNVTGSFAAGEMYLVSPLVEGLSVTEFLAEEGDMVKKGQVLARLDSSAIDIQIMQAQANLARNDLAVDQTQNQILQAQIGVDKSDNDLERNWQSLLSDATPGPPSRPGDALGHERLSQCDSPTGGNS